jgi:hydrogenase expression/formation protein HypC
MCLGIPGCVVEILDGYHGQIALVDVSGKRRKVNIGLLEDDPAEPGDWVIIHMGFAVQKTDRAGADRAMDGLRLMGPGERR